MNARARLESGELVWDRALREAVAGLGYDEVKNELAAIMRAHCTPELAGDQPSSWAPTGTFAGINPGELTVTAGDDGDVLIEGEMGQFEGQRFQFTLVRTEQGFRIRAVASEGEPGEWEAWCF